MNSQVLFRRLKKLTCSVAFLAFASVPSLAGAIDITVTGTADTADGPDTCAVAATVSCPSLRSAIRYANETSPDPDTITLPAGTYTLSIDGVDETWAGTGTEPDPYVADITPDATVGDLDITDSLTINGAVDGNGYVITTIAWDTKDITDPNVGDRIFHVTALTGTTISATFSNLILSNGSVGVVPNTDCADDTNPYDIERIVGPPPDELCSIWQFRRYGGAVALGFGAGIAFYEEAVHGPDAGGGGKKPPDIGPPDDHDEEGGTISDVTFNRVAIISNSAGADGGGIHSAAPAVITESVISGNFSGANGGGIYNDAEITIDRTTIGTATSVPLVENVALVANPNIGENGGALFDTGFHTTTITASAINGNEAIGGGGIAGRALIVFDITNTTISGNVAFDVGGGITTNGTINLNSSTVVNNEASTDAPGGGAGLNSFGDGTYNLHNTIVANNLKNSTVDSNCGCSGGSATCAAGRIVSLGYNLENADTCQFAFTGDLTNTNPQLLALANNGGPTETHALQHTANGDAVDSPAVEAGDNNNCPNNDQRGGIRPADGDLNTNYDCDIGAFELFIASADLHFNNMTAPDEVNKGDTIAIQAEVHNPPTATVPATGVEVATTFDAELTSPSATFSVDGGTATACNTVSSVVTCVVGTLNQNSAAIINLSANASTEGSYSVSSVISATTGDPDTTNNIASVSTTVIGNSDMQVLATPDQNSVDIGDNVTVTATLTNGGPDQATNVRVGTTIPDEVTFVSAIPSAGSCSEMDSDRSVACDFGSISNGATANVVYEATIEIAGSISWNIQTNADQSDTDTTNNSVEVLFTGIANSDLDLTQSASASSIDIGNNITVVATLSNAGPQDASNALVVTTIPDEVTLVSATPSAGSCSAMNASRIVSCEIGGVVNGESATVSYVATVADAGSISWATEASADQNDPDATNNTAEANFTGVANSDLALAQSANPVGAYIGGSITITATLNNAGPQAATSVRAVTTIPDEMTLVSVLPSAGTCGAMDANRQVTCDIGNLANGGNANVVIVATVAEPGSISWTTSVSADQNDPDTGNNSASSTITGAVEEEDENFFEKVFGCTIGQGNGFDPTLLLVVILSLLHLTRKEVKASLTRK